MVLREMFFGNFHKQYFFMSIMMKLLINWDYLHNRHMSTMKWTFKCIMDIACPRENFDFMRFSVILDKYYILGG